MKQRIFDEKNGLWYELHGDYYLPCLTVPEQKFEYGIWGERRRMFLREHRRVSYYNLLTSCTLDQHLADVDKSADDLMESLVSQLVKTDGITEALKAADPMEWVRQMENIRSRAREIVYNDLIYA